jgi:hypothetical protein
MATSPDARPVLPASDVVDLDALFEGAPVLLTPHDLAAPSLFPDDEEFDEFLAAYRADR